ncbi:MAG: ATP-binding protein [Clostridiales bacterium]|nr:ATP-binding protein [Clostridiales bacterium]
MMTEISLNILDVAQNSISAGAKLIEITIIADTKNDILITEIKDNGCGMDKDKLENVINPFFTTRTTRRVGLGIPFYKLAAENTGGSFKIVSQVGIGTTVTATFGLSHIDCMPLGDINSTIHTLVTLNSHIDFFYMYKIDEKSFTLDTREFREILGDISFNSPDVSVYIYDYLNENKQEVDGEKVI